MPKASHAARARASVIFSTYDDQESQRRMMRRRMAGRNKSGGPLVSVRTAEGQRIAKLMKSARKTQRYGEAAKSH